MHKDNQPVGSQIYLQVFSFLTHFGMPKVNFKQECISDLEDS